METQGFCPVGKAERLLLSTDCSQFSEGAVREAIEFAKKCSSTLYVMSVVEFNPDYETLSLKHVEKEQAGVQAHLDSIMARASAAGIPCEVFFRTDRDPHKAIVEEAHKRTVDMIIIGKRGTTGLAKLLLGEVAAKVIGYAPCKVLVVPREAQIQYRTILVGTDGSRHSEAAASEAVGIAKRCGSRIIVLSSAHGEADLKDAQANVDKVLEIARTEGVPAEGATPVGNSYQTIVEVAGGRGADLIVVGTYGKTGLMQMLMGSSTERVIGLAQCAVLVVRAEGT